MSTGGESAKLVEEPDETSAFPKSSPKNGVPGGEAMLEAEDLIEFIDPLPKDFKCSLCLQYLKQPTLTNCGHHFCKQCIDRAVERSRKLKQGPVCPLCKEKDFQMFIDRSTERKISSLRVYCLKKSQGCGWEGELGSLNHHMDLKEGDCGFVQVECKFYKMGCTTSVLRKDLLKHMEENTHKHIILMSVLGSQIGDGSLELNLKLQEQTAEMLQMQICCRDEEFQQRLESLEKKLEMKSEELARMEQKLRVKDEEMQRQLWRSEKVLKRRIAELEHNLEGRGPFYFIVPNFTKLKANSTEWYSPPFYTHPGGYRLSLRVQANWYGSDSVKRVSWCLYTEPGEYDELLKWPRQSPNCYIQVLNHCTSKWKRYLSCGTATFKKPAPARQCSDCWHAVPHSYLQYNTENNVQYLKDDCLHFRIVKIEFTD